MKNKKIIVLAIFIVIIFSVSAVDAADNLTDEVVSTDLEINEVTSSDDLKTDDVTNNYGNATDSQEVLAVGGDEKIALNEEDILSASSPSYSQYYLSVDDTTISAGKSGTVTIHITPCSNSNYYAYDFYFNVYDSNGNRKINENLYSSTKSTSCTYTISANTLSAGTYTIKLENYKDGHVMDTATLKVVSSSVTHTYPYYYDYSVSLSDYSMSYGSSGSISMYVTPSLSSSYNYFAIILEFMIPMATM